MDSRTLRLWALLTLSGGNLVWTLSFIAATLGESPTYSHHWPGLIGLLFVASFGVAAAALALVSVKHSRACEICSAIALFAYFGGWLWFFGIP